MSIRHDGCDYISSLPIDLVVKILTALPLQDAARTSVLSSLWRNYCRKLTVLVFDESIVEASPLDPYCAHHNLSVRLHNGILDHEGILGHDGPIHKFVFSISLYHINYEMKIILRHVLSKGVKDLTLHLNNKGLHHSLPSSVYSCCQLTHLDLRGCSFTPPTSFMGFPNLVLLIFSDVIVSIETLTALVLNCPLLEHIEVETLATSDSREASYYPTIAWSRLKVLFDVVCLKNPQLCATFSFCLDLHRSYNFRERKPAVVFGLSGSYPITMYDRCLLEDMIPDWLPNSINLKHLNKLKLSKIRLGMESDVRHVFSLMTCCPKLQNLTLEVYGGSCDRVRAFFNTVWNMDFSSCKIRGVEIRNISGWWPELEFIKILLGQLPELEKMHIIPEQHMARARETSLLEEVMQFSLASPDAEIKFKKAC